MNKKDISTLKRQFKEESDLDIKQICRFYMKSDSKKIIYKESTLFGRKDDIEQELYMMNFKKMLTGNIDSKIFELNFSKNDSDDKNHGQNILNEMLKMKTVENLEEEAIKIMNKLAENYFFDTDIVASFVKVQWNKPQEKKKHSKEAYCEDYSHFEFIMCSINRVEILKQNMIFGNDPKGFTPTNGTDVTINLLKPIEGFIYPSFSGNASDMSKIIYCTSRSGNRNFAMIENVINCDYSYTAKEEKDKFEQITTTLIDKRVKSDVIKGIYEKIDFSIQSQNEEEGRAVVGKKEIKKVFELNGIDISKFDEVFDGVMGKASQLRAGNIIPDYHTKSLKISTAVANIMISPRDLDNVKQVVDSRGRKCILIEIGEDVEINGIKMQSENL